MPTSLALHRYAISTAVVAVAIVSCVSLRADAALRTPFLHPSAATIQWAPVGPAAGQIGSGKVNALAFVQSNPDIMYLAGGWGNTPRESPSQMGIYKTNDRGAHWTTLDNGLTNPDGTISSVVNDLWLDQSNPSIVLASTEFGGTFRTTNAGATWTNVNRQEATQFSQAGSALYLATRQGIMASTDDGATWTITLQITTGATTVVTAGGATYAGSTAGDVYRLNAGVWTKTGHPGTGPVHDLAVDPFNTQVVYANVDDVTAWNQDLYGSIDGGVTWKEINCNCSVGAQAIAFSLVVPNRIYLGDDGGGYIFYFTADGNPNPTISDGATPDGVDMRYIVLAASKTKGDDACYLLMDQGLFYAPACTAGTAGGLGNQIPDTLAYDVKVSQNGENAIVPLQDNSAAGTTNGGATWVYNSTDNAGEGGEAFINPYNPEDCYFAHPDYGFYVSVNACATFNAGNSLTLESLTADPTHAGKLYAVNSADSVLAHVVVSTNAGQSWNQTSWSFKNPYQVVVSPADYQTILVATGKTGAAQTLYYTHDGGKSWTAATGLPTTTTPVSTIYFPVHQFYATFEPGSSGTILLADHDPTTNDVLIYRSTDNGQSFALVQTFVQPSTPRPWPYLVFPTSEERNPHERYYATRFYGNRLAFNPQAAAGTTPAVVLTTRFGAYISYDQGSTWQRIDDNAIAHHFIGIDWNSGYVFLASFGQGAIRSTTPLQ